MNPRDRDGLPFTKNIYYLQALTEMHIYLKTEHEFTPGEVNDLLMFADPLSVVRHCGGLSLSASAWAVRAASCR